MHLRQNECFKYVCFSDFCLKYSCPRKFSFRAVAWKKAAFNPVCQLMLLLSSLRTFLVEEVTSALTWESAVAPTSTDAAPFPSNQQLLFSASYRQKDFFFPLRECWLLLWFVLDLGVFMIQVDMKFVKFMLQFVMCRSIKSRSWCKFCILLERLRTGRP